MSPRVSLTMIVKNEEKNLPDCLACIADLVDEMIVVDTGSADRTKELAANAGARVFDFPWIDDFAAARNEALRHATGDWIFWLDADDRIDEVHRQRLKSLFAGLGDENVVYMMKCLCQSPIGVGSASELEHARLFRRHPEIRWKYRVHEQIVPAVEGLGGVQRACDVVIQHVGYHDRATRQQKLLRDLRLLQAENMHHPGDALTLFHLGWTWHLMGNAALALPVLDQCLKASRPQMAIVRKTYILVVRSLRQLGDFEQALSFSKAARVQYPYDAELCLHEGQLLKERGDFAGAEACLKQLFELPAGYYTSIGDDPDLRGYKGRCALAEVYRDSGRLLEAEVQYRLILSEHPEFTVAWLSLADIMVSQQRWDDAEQLAQNLATIPGEQVNALLLRSRSHMFRQEFEQARKLADEAIQREPNAPWPREVLSHILIMEGRDWVAAERVLRGLLALQPTNSTALANLAMVESELAKSRPASTF